MTRLLSMLSTAPVMPGPAFWRGFATGLAAPVYLYSVPRYVYPHATVEDALRADWEHIGADFRGAFEFVREEIQGQEIKTPA